MAFNEKELAKLDIPKKQLERLRSKKILLGHQSVGNNIIEGIKHLANHNPELGLNVELIHSPDDFDQPLLGHFLVGKNGDPKSKCDSFKEIMDSGIGNKVDIAFFKLCYVDIHGTTDLRDITDYYVKTMEYLKNKYSNVTFIHVTIPLTAISEDFKTKVKSLIKKIMKKSHLVYAANIQRNKYNNLIYYHYYDKDPIYDLAAIEYTWPNGHQQSFMHSGKAYYSLVPIYTYDGGHLNDLGQIQAAKALLKQLSDIN
jgi:hypothetical protein